MEKFLAKKWMIFLLFASLTYLFGTKTDRRYGWTNENSRDAYPIVSDGAGYYAFLPNWFIYEGPDFEFIKGINEKYPDRSFEDNLSALGNGKLYDKYYTGTAQCLSPFFLVGHAHANLAGVETDGYTWPYQLWLNVGMIFYAIFGLVCLFRLLRRLKISYFVSYLTIIGLGAATNICFYVYYHIPYSHIFSFALVNAVLLFWLKWIQEKRSGSLILFAFFFGLSLVIRPTNGLILIFLPFLFEKNTDLFTRLKELFQAANWKTWGSTFAAFGIPVLIQLVSNRAQTGTWSLNAYSNEGFDHWKDPYMLEILFGFRKGMFVYAPFLLLMIPGLVILFLRSRRLFYGVLVLTLLSAYVLSSWWCWWYGGALGMRSMIDFYGILAIPIACLLHVSNTFWKIFLLVFVFCSGHIYQTYERQYDKNIIHFDYMNYPMWKKIFMKEDPRLSWVFHSKIDTLPGGIRPVSQPLGFSVKGKPLSPDVVYGTSDHPVLKELPGMEKRLHVKNGDSFVGIRVSMKVYLNTPNENPTLLAQFFKGDSLIGQKETMVGWRPQNVNEWETISVDFTPEYRWKDIDSVACRFQTRQDLLQFRDMKIQFFEYK